MSAGDALTVALHVARALESLEIPYLVGGSLASSLHGIPRSTVDVDVVVDLHIEQAESLVARLIDSYYVDIDSVREAVRARGSFNIIHLATMVKVDLFVASEDAVSRRQIERRQTFVVDDETGETLAVASAEDTVVQKLRWYELGRHVSERQWLDVCGILKVKGRDLDLTYMQGAASELGVQELLTKALEETK